MQVGKICTLWCLLSCAGISSPASAQTSNANEWTWVAGSNTIGTTCSQVSFCGQVGVYGTQGVASAANAPGSRSSGATWTDSSGHLWLFGGAGFDVSGNDFYLNDVWVFDPSTSLWTWVGGSDSVNQSGLYGTLGVPSTGNIPGARITASTWTDSNGNFWLFGGWGLDANGSYYALSDLWQFNPSTNEWVWRSGGNTVNQPGVYGTLGTAAPGNVPGGRYEAASWIDGSGRLWLFGGYGFDSNGVLGTLNDLWRFEPSSKEWTWMGGNSMAGSYCTNGVFCGYAGSYGTMGAPAPGNIPGSRTSSVAWTDAAGHFWLAFGQGYDGAGTWGDLDDIWEYDPAVNQWTWMGGYSDIGPLGRHAGVYGTFRTVSADNFPGSRASGSVWTDASGNFWLFGGEGWDAKSDTGELNELWEFFPSTNQWAWMGGISTIGPHDNLGQSGWPGTYGSLGTPAAANIPGSRFDAMNWADNKDRFWLFGGEGFDSKGNWGFLNDLWEYQPSNTTSGPQPDFTVAASASSLTLQADQKASSIVTVTPLGGFASTVTFSCSGLPAGVLCIFSPTAVIPTGGAAATTVTVSISPTLGYLRGGENPFFPVAGLISVSFCLYWKRIRRAQILGILFLASLGAISACGGGAGGSNQSSQVVTSTMTITANSGSLQHTTTLSVTIR